MGHIQWGLFITGTLISLFALHFTFKFVIRPFIKLVNNKVNIKGNSNQSILNSTINGDVNINNDGE